MFVTNSLQPPTTYLKVKSSLAGRRIGFPVVGEIMRLSMIVDKRVVCRGRDHDCGQESSGLQNDGWMEIIEIDSEVRDRAR